MKKLIEVKLERAENLTPKVRKKYHLPDTGLVVHEYWSDGSIIGPKKASEKLKKYIIKTMEEIKSGTSEKRFSRLFKEARL